MPSKLPPIEETMLWVLLHPRATPEMLGFIPGSLSLADPRPAREQLASNYIGGWEPFEGFTLEKDGSLCFPGDPPMRPIAMTTMRKEHIVLYEHSWLLIMQPDETWEVARLD